MSNGPLILKRGKHYVPHFSNLRAVLPLYNLSDQIAEVQTTTLDGITVWVREIRFGFALISDQEMQGKMNVPLEKREYVQALEKIIYLHPTDILTVLLTQDSFVLAVRAVIEDEIKSFINHHLLDEISTPSHNMMEARLDIENRLLSAEIQKRFSDNGARLLWVDIGYFDNDKKVEEQRINTWKAEWNGRANVIQA